MRLILIEAVAMVSLIASGCAHKTLHEQCTANDEYERYGSYDRCVAEKAEERERRVQAFERFRSGMESANQSLEKAFSQPASNYRSPASY